MIPFIIPPDDKSMAFPNVELAFDEPNGLLAVGGDLSKDRLLSAYKCGIFPWYSKHQPILWWSPNPRLVLTPSEIHISRSLHKVLKKNIFKITYDTAFEQVILGCAKPREKEKDTWITQSMFDAYVDLHRAGYAHSFEAWQDNKLVGGLYGVAIGQVFFGESMFSLVSNASKVTFKYTVDALISWGFQLIDCQVETNYLMDFGARNIDRRDFIKRLENLTSLQTESFAWQQSIDHEH